MGKYGVGIWGAGWVAGGHLTGYLAQANCEIVAIGSRRQASVDALAERFGLECATYTDYEAFLAHPGLDVVSVCTPHHLHASNTIDAARAGKHVYVEKPLAVTLRDLYAMRDAVRDAGVCAVTGFVVRWMPLVARLRQLVREGAFGDLRVVDADYWHSRRRPESYRRRATGGSAMLLGGVHAVDTARFLLGSEPVEITARSVQVSSESDASYEFDSAEVCLVRYANGAVGRLSAIVDGHMPYQFNIDLLGDHGIARDNRIFLKGDAEESGFRSLSEAGPDSGSVDHHPFEGLIAHFLECIETGREPEVSVEQAVRVHELCFGALLSARSGQPVGLPLNEQDQAAIHDLLDLLTAALA